MLYPDIRLILEHRATAFALFVKSQRKWTSPPTKPESISSFKDRLGEFGYSADHILPHGSYLMNMGNPDKYVDSPQKHTRIHVTNVQRETSEVLRVFRWRTKAMWRAGIETVQFPVRLVSKTFPFGLEIESYPIGSPGSTVGQVTVEESLSFIAECINNAHKETSSIVIVIENMVRSCGIATLSSDWNE